MLVKTSKNTVHESDHDQKYLVPLLNSLGSVAKSSQSEAPPFETAPRRWIHANAHST